MVLPPELIAKLAICAKSDFTPAREAWFGWLARSTDVVAVGLVLELPELVIELAEIAHRRCAFLKNRIKLGDGITDVAKLIAFFGWFLIVGGVVGERVAEVHINDLNKSIQSCNTAQLMGATLDSGDAQTSAQGAAQAAHTVKLEADSLKADIKSAKETAASAVERLAVAQERIAAATERTARLEQQLSWRTVTPEQSDKLAHSASLLRLNGLFPLKDVHVSFIYLGEDAESGEYAMELSIALRKALAGLGATVDNPSGAFVSQHGPPVQGLVMSANPESQPALAIQHALKDAGISAPVKVDKEMSPNDISFLIGVKPRLKPPD